MDVVSTCPLRVAKAVFQPRPGAFTLIVACKATYDLQPTLSPLAAVQEEAREVDSHLDHDATRSVYMPSDLAPFKRGADVMLVGSAFAPGGGPVRALVASLQVGDVHKEIEVWCDRSFAYDGRVIEGPRFSHMPLCWERAAGGPDTSNPVGMRFDARPNALGRVPIPNLKPPRATFAEHGDTFDPIGFGPIAPSWPGRARWLHRHAAGFPHRRWFDRPLPSNIDARYFNAAPPDQQTDPLPPDARIILENLHPAHPRLVTNLAGVRPRAAVERPGRAPAPIELTCDTLWIDTDRALCTLTFRGIVQLEGLHDAGRVTVWMDGAAPLTEAQVTETVAFTGAELASHAPLPFFQSAALEAEQDTSDTARTAPRLPRPPAPSIGSAWDDEVSATADPLAAASELAALPFRPAPAASPSPAPLAEEDVEDDAEPDTLRPAPAAPSQPWFPAPAEPEPSPAAAPRPAPAPEVKPLSVEVYAAVRVAFWSHGEGSRVAIEDTLRDLGLDEETFRAGEARLLDALAAEAREGRTLLARALRAAMNRERRALAAREGGQRARS